jgi:hypothetical protein
VEKVDDNDIEALTTTMASFNTYQSGEKAWHLQRTRDKPKKGKRSCL